MDNETELKFLLETVAKISIQLTHQQAQIHSLTKISDSQTRMIELLGKVVFPQQ